MSWRQSLSVWKHHALAQNRASHSKTATQHSIPCRTPLALGRSCAGTMRSHQYWTRPRARCVAWQRSIPLALACSARRPRPPRCFQQFCSLAPRRRRPCPGGSQRRNGFPAARP
eukprot:3621346-Rhodomonas_salina.4